MRPWLSGTGARQRTPLYPYRAVCARSRRWRALRRSAYWHSMAIAGRRPFAARSLIAVPEIRFLWHHSMNCRHCGKSLQHVFLDLGFAPPSNALLDLADLELPETYYP